MKRPNWIVPVCLVLLSPGLADAERRDHGAHVHGIAEMDVAAIGGELEIALRSPAMNLVGFEHEARTDEQRQRLHETVEQLRDGAALFAFGEAACGLVEAAVAHERDAGAHGDHDEHDEHDHDGHDEHADGDEHAEHGHEEHDHEAEHGHDDHAQGDDHDDASHSEFRAHYQFACEGEVTRLETRLFERFPGTESIRVQYLTDDSQGAQTLTPAAPVLRLE